MSRYETFDPKVLDSIEEKSTAGPLETSAPGISISSWLPKTASVMHHCFLFRDLESRQHLGEDESHFHRTGYLPRVTMRYPDIGAWCAASVPDGSYFRLNSDREEGASFFSPPGYQPGCHRESRGSPFSRYGEAQLGRAGQSSRRDRERGQDDSYRRTEYRTRTWQRPADDGDGNLEEAE